ncbi:hypothetical protein [Nonomuraea sp. B19D2]|uniref:hypothetical protein n=1 Tax=Nonomuraea sp. B19D2 TaxID=3159561 RepID=UPI0032DAA3DB
MKKGMAIKYAAKIEWRPYAPKPEAKGIWIKEDCDGKYIWAVEDDLYLIIRRTENGLEETERVSFDKARVMWDMLVRAYRQRRAILTEYEVQARCIKDEKWVPHNQRERARVSETSCCAAYEWASHGGLFFILRRTKKGYEETGRGLFREARKIWDELTRKHAEEHQKEKEAQRKKYKIGKHTPPRNRGVKERGQGAA